MAQSIGGDLGYRVILYDASGNPILTGPLGLDSADKLRVSLYAQGSVAGDSSLLVQSAASPNLRVSLYSSGNQVRVSNLAADSEITGTISLWANAAGYVFNSASWDRYRNNHEVTALASAARTASVNSADLVSYNARGVIVVVDVTAIVDTPSITVTIAGKDTLSGKYVSILASAAIVGTGTTALIVYPGNSAAANAKADQPLPRIWRVQVVNADSDSITYSVGVNYIV